MSTQRTVGEMRADLQAKVPDPATARLLDTIFAAFGPDDRVLTDEELTVATDGLVSELGAREAAWPEVQRKAQRRRARRAHLRELMASLRDRQLQRRADRTYLDDEGRRVLPAEELTRAERHLIEALLAQRHEGAPGPDVWSARGAGAGPDPGA